MVLAFICCCIIGLRYHRGERQRIIFLGYSFMGVLLAFLVTAVDYSHILPVRGKIMSEEILNTVFELVEFSCFYYFFRKCLENKKIHKISKAFLITLFVISAFFFTLLFWQEYTLDEIKEHSFFINVIELFFLAFLCLAYFYELFTTPPRINLFERPSFFITTSTFFYSVLLIPFFIIARDLWKQERPLFSTLFSCHYVLLSFVLLSISRAFLRKVPITT
jgi:hypothetical protein